MRKTSLLFFQCCSTAAFSKETAFIYKTCQLLFTCSRITLILSKVQSQHLEGMLLIQTKWYPSFPTVVFNEQDYGQFLQAISSINSGSACIPKLLFLMLSKAFHVPGLLVELRAADRDVYSKEKSWNNCFVVPYSARRWSSSQEVESHSGYLTWFNSPSSLGYRVGVGTWLTI